MLLQPSDSIYADFVVSNADSSVSSLFCPFSGLIVLVADYGRRCCKSATGWVSAFGAQSEASGREPPGPPTRAAAFVRARGPLLLKGSRLGEFSNVGEARADT